MQHYFRTFTNLVLLVICLGVASCGGGGGSPTSPNEPPSPEAFSPVDVTPQWLNDEPLRCDTLAVSEGYAYIPSQGDLIILDIDPPESTHLVSTTPVPLHISHVLAVEGYLYLVAGYYLYVVDVEIPETPQIINTITDFWNINDICIRGNYLYVTGGDIFTVYDITNPEDIFCINSIETPNYQKMAITEDLALVGQSKDFDIIEINPPETIEIIKSFTVPFRISDFEVTEGYAFILDEYSGEMQIFDIDPPENLHNIGKPVESMNYPHKITIVGDYAYVSEQEGGVKIIDIDPPETAFIASVCQTPGWAYEVAVSGRYAFIACGAGLRIIKLW